MIFNGSRQWLAPIILLSTDQEGADHGKVPDHARVPLPELMRALRTVVYFHSKLINELTVLDEQKGLVFRNASLVRSEEGRKASAFCKQRLSWRYNICNLKQNVHLKCGDQLDFPR